MSHLILVRHGNTFETGETPRWVGARTDMELTVVGEEQARAAADMIAKTYLPLGALIAGPLLRTRRFAEIIGEAAGTEYSIDDRLTEIDYGLWENKSNEEIRSLHGAAMLEAWDKGGLWPDGMDFSPSRAVVEDKLRAFLNDQHIKLMNPETRDRVAVTSNGIMRLIFALVTGKKPGAEAKVRPGNYCLLRPRHEGWAIESWNARPE